MVLKHTKEYYLKFFLAFVLLFFMFSYAILNSDTIIDQVEIVKEGGTFFATSAIYEIFDIKSPFSIDTKMNSQTYEIELLIHKQINEIRKENGLRELNWDPMLGRIARYHSENMIVEGFFNHTDPFGNGPQERAKELGLKQEFVFQGEKARGIGENIAITPRGKVDEYGILISTEDIASATVLGWMLSESHKKTILTEDFYFSGVGVVYDGYRYYYLTQNFQ